MTAECLDFWASGSTNPKQKKTEQKAPASPKEAQMQHPHPKKRARHHEARTKAPRSTMPGGQAPMASRTSWAQTTHNQLEPIGSMYAIDGNIHHQYTPNVAYIPAPWILWGMNMRPNRQLVKSPMSFDCFSGHRRNVPRKGKPYEGMDFS